MWATLGITLWVTLGFKVWAKLGIKIQHRLGIKVESTLWCRCSEVDLVVKGTWTQRHSLKVTYLFPVLDAYLSFNSRFLPQQ